MVFSYNPNYHMHFTGEKTASSKPVDIPGENVKFLIKKPLRGVIIDINGVIHCYPNVEPGNYLITILVEKNNRLIDSTELVLFVRDKNDDSLREVDLSEKTQIIKSSKHKSNKKNKHYKKKEVSSSTSSSSSKDNKGYKFTSYFNFTNTKYGLTIVVFSLLIAFLNSISKN